MEQRKYGLRTRKPKLNVNNIILYTILRTSQPENLSNYTHDVKEQDFRYFSLFTLDILVYFRNRRKLQSQFTSV